MGILKASSDVGATASLVTSILSIVSCMLVIWFIVDYRKKKKSYHLELVGRLLVCDVGICLTIVLFYIMDIVLERTQMPDFCNLFLPVVSYFFLTSYAWTVMLALRFRTSHDRNSSGELKPLVPFHVIWLVPLGLVLVLVIVAYSAGHVTKVVEGDDDDSKQACTFDHDHMAGIVLDLVIVQAPNLLTILLNVYIYACGLAALSNAPHSVLARQMRKAGGYLAILIIVWVPNVVYNMLSIIDTSHRGYDSLLDLAVLLVSLQGFLNVCVYVWSNMKMRRWFVRQIRKYSNAFISKLRGKSTSTTASGHSKDRHALFAASKSHSSTRDEEEYSDEDEDVASWLKESSSFSGHMSDSVAESVEGGKNSSLTGTMSPMTHSLVEGNRASNPRDTSSLTRPSSSGKSILIQQSIVSRKSGSGKQMARSSELDNEKFVRFGETSTRVISVATTPRTSEFGVEDMDYEDDDEAL